MKFSPKIVPIASLNSGADLYVREMSWRERKAFEEKVGLGKEGVDQDNLPGFAEGLVAQSVCDKDGNLVFNSGGIEEVLDLPASVFWCLFREAQKMNTLSDSNVESATKN